MVQMSVMVRKRVIGGDLIAPHRKRLADFYRRVRREEKPEDYRTLRAWCWRLGQFGFMAPRL